MSSSSENDFERSIASIECLRRNITHFRDIYGPFPDETVTDFVDRMLNVFGISEQDVFDIFNLCPTARNECHFDSVSSTSEEITYKSLEDDSNNLISSGSIGQTYQSVLGSLENSKSVNQISSEEIESDEENVIKRRRNKAGNNNHKKELSKPSEAKKIKDVKQDVKSKKDTKNEQKQTQQVSKPGEEKKKIPKQNQLEDKKEKIAKQKQLEEKKEKIPKQNQLEEKKEKIRKQNQLEEEKEKLRKQNQFEEKKEETTKNKGLKKQVEQKQEQKNETRKQNQSYGNESNQNKEVTQEKKSSSTKQKALKWGSNLFTKSGRSDSKSPKTEPSKNEKPTIIATTWAISRVNIFNDCTRTFEIMKPKKPIPKSLIPEQSSFIFAVMPSGICICFDCLPKKSK